VNSLPVEFFDPRTAKTRLRGAFFSLDSLLFSGSVMRLVSFRAGVILTSGTGFLRPVHFQCSWPLQRIDLIETGVQCSPSTILSRIGFSIETIRWEEMQAIECCWLGMRIHYRQQEMTYELEITAPGAYNRTQTFLRDIQRHEDLFCGSAHDNSAPRR
jgi:hypothetical protein